MRIPIVVLIPVGSEAEANQEDEPHPDDPKNDKWNYAGLFGSPTEDQGAEGVDSYSQRSKKRRSVSWTVACNADFTYAKATPTSPHCFSTPGIGCIKSRYSDGYGIENTLCRTGITFRDSLKPGDSGCDN